MDVGQGGECKVERGDNGGIPGKLRIKQRGPGRSRTCTGLFVCLRMDLLFLKGGIFFGLLVEGIF